MGPTRKRDLAAAVLIAGIVGYLAALLAYPRYFPPISLWTGLSLLGVAVAIAAWGVNVRNKIRDGEIGDGPGRLHPLAVARSVVIAKASAWVGAPVLGWWAGVLVQILPQRGALRAAGEDVPGVVIAAASALALTIAGLWLQNCCKSPPEPPEDPDPSSD
uniref:Putative conserved secreted protein n=2 Tax=unclassified Mycobacterium TaxID=2642494 RepID=A0A5Q5BQU5_MYCSS